jgi:hypothetical protein
MKLEEYEGRSSYICSLVRLLADEDIKCISLAAKKIQDNYSLSERKTLPDMEVMMIYTQIQEEQGEISQ